jgi:hypothetical protein
LCYQSKIFKKQLKQKIMKKQSNTLFIEISKEQVENLTTIVKETIAAGYNQAQTKLFTAADLWNIQRQKKDLANAGFHYKPLSETIKN